jgi:hypothetical protein
MNSQTDKYLLDDDTIEDLVKELCKEIESYYVFPKIAKKIPQSLI